MALAPKGGGLPDGDRYRERRAELHHYFDRHAAEAWARLTSDAPVSKVRATVRKGRDMMRAELLSRLPDDLSGCTLLDAGCGTGALAVAAASRGASVSAVDLSETMVGIARERTALALPAGVSAEPGRIAFAAGDMLAPEGPFDHVVAMDSLIHYRLADVIDALATLAPKTRRSILFTHAPATPLLSVMHAAGRFFPRGDKAPAIVPTSSASLARAIAASPALAGFAIASTRRIASGFYTSEAVELVRQC